MIGLDSIELNSSNSSNTLALKCLLFTVYCLPFTSNKLNWSLSGCTKKHGGCLHVLQHKGKSPVGGIQPRAVRPILDELAELSCLQLGSQYVLNGLPPHMTTNFLECSFTCAIITFFYLHITALGSRLKPTQTPTRAHTPNLIG